MGVWDNDKTHRSRIYNLELTPTPHNLVSLHIIRPTVVEVRRLGGHVPSLVHSWLRHRCPDFNAATSILPRLCSMGYRQPPLRQNPLVRLNSLQSKLPALYCECCDRERQINSSRCILCTLRRTKNNEIDITTRLNAFARSCLFNATAVAAQCHSQQTNSQ